jgi:hypothetical protein
MTEDDLGAAAMNVMLGVLGDFDAAAATGPLLATLLQDAFTLASELTTRLAGTSDWTGALFGPGAFGGNWETRLSGWIGAAMPTDMLRSVTASLAGAMISGSPGAVPAPPAKERAQEVIKPLQKLLSSMSGPAPAEALMALTAFADGYSKLIKLSIGALPPDAWSLDNAIKSIRDLIEYWVRELGAEMANCPHLSAAIADIRVEMAWALGERFLVASAFSLGGLAAYGKQDFAEDFLLPASSMDLGNRLQRVLCQEYREATGRAGNLIVQEGTVYFPATSGPRRAGQQLGKVRFTDIRLTALWLARTAALLMPGVAVPGSMSLRSSLRSDNLDLTVGSIWEIKPIRGAAPGVVQEFGYRSFYNIFVALAQDLPDVASRLFSLVQAITGQPGGPGQPGQQPGQPGKPILARECVRGGIPSQWAELSKDDGVRVISNTASLPADVVMVVTFDPLPGLVLYLRFDLPLATVAALAPDVRKALKKIADRLERAADVIITAFALVLTMAIAVALVFLAVQATVEAAIGIGLLLQQLAGPAAGQVGDLLQKIIQQIQPLRQKYGLSVHGTDSSGAARICLRFQLADGTPDNAVVCASATFGLLRLENAPTQVLAAVPGILTVASGLTASLVQRWLDSTPTS